MYLTNLAIKLSAMTAALQVSTDDKGPLLRSRVEVWIVILGVLALAGCYEGENVFRGGETVKTVRSEYFYFTKEGNYVPIDDEDMHSIVKSAVWETPPGMSLTGSNLKIDRSEVRVHGDATTEFICPADGGVKLTASFTLKIEKKAPIGEKTIVLLHMPAMLTIASAKGAEPMFGEANTFFSDPSEDFSYLSKDSVGLHLNVQDPASSTLFSQIAKVGLLVIVVLLSIVFWREA